MKNNINSQVKEKAYFVAGLSAWFRDADDQTTASAIRDAENFLHHLSENTPEPMISGGTTASPEVILSLTWLVGGYMEIKSVYVAFLGDEKCDVYWDEPNGTRNEMKGILIKHLVEQEISQKITDLSLNAPHNTFKEPWLH